MRILKRNLNKLDNNFIIRNWLKDLMSFMCDF